MQNYMVRHVIRDKKYVSAVTWLHAMLYMRAVGDHPSSAMHRVRYLQKGNWWWHRSIGGIGSTCEDGVRMSLSQLETTELE